MWCSGQEQAAAKLPARSSLPTMASSQNLNKYAKNIRNFVKAALDRQTTVLLQPSGMSKRKSNTSRYDPQQDLIAWKIMAVFIIKSDFSLSEVIGLDVNSDQMNQTAALQKAGICLQTQVSEKERIADIRSKMLQSVQSGTILRQALKPLIAQMDALVCYLRVLPAQANRPLFRQIASDSSLREAMSGMTVMEFPTLYFGPAAAMERLPVLLHEDTAAALVEDLAPAGEAAVDDSNSACDEEDSNGSEEDVEDGDSSSVSSEEEEAEAVLAAPTSTASSASPALASKKNVSFGGMLIADYSSDSDSEEEEEQPAVVPGASDKYRDFMNQLLAMQGAAQTDAVVMEEGEC